mmetsp:Transcript_9481/g.38435  ORF Transcript_9481/g.38435 Transcript_9481/m.38435 type:complete len:216 (-) Transcript_9481:5180-5827(-)
MDAVAGGSVWLFAPGRARGAALVPGSGEAQGEHPGRHRRDGAGIGSRRGGRVAAVGARGGGARGDRFLLLLQPGSDQFRRLPIPPPRRAPPSRRTSRVATHGITVRKDRPAQPRRHRAGRQSERADGLRRRRRRQAAALVLRAGASRGFASRHAPEPAVRPGIGRQLGVHARRGSKPNVPARGGVRPDGERVNRGDDGAGRRTERGERAGVRVRV